MEQQNHFAFQNRWLSQTSVMKQVSCEYLLVAMVSHNNFGRVLVDYSQRILSLTALMVYYSLKLRIDINTRNWISHVYCVISKVVINAFGRSKLTL